MRLLGQAAGVEREDADRQRVRAIRSISTMSSAPKLDASTAGAMARRDARSSVAAAASMRRASVIASAIGVARGSRCAAAEPAACGVARGADSRRRSRARPRSASCASRSSRSANASKPHCAQVVELVAQDVADRAQLAAIAVALAQQARGRIAAAVGELREVDGDHRQRADVAGERRRIVGRREPHADVAAREQRVALARATARAAR